MIHVDITLEDARLIATYDGLVWNTTLLDNHSGLSQRVEWNNDQLWAVVTLALGDDELEPTLAKHLYEIAEPLFTNLPGALRIIP